MQYLDVDIFLFEYQSSDFIGIHVKDGFQQRRLGKEIIFLVRRLYYRMEEVRVLRLENRDTGGETSRAVDRLATRHRLTIST